MNNPYDHAPVRVRRQATRWAHVDAVVSIHAPVRVRPEKTALKEYLSQVSIHAPVRVRLFRPVIIVKGRMFQSTHP